MTDWLRTLMRIAQQKTPSARKLGRAFFLFVHVRLIEIAI